MLNIDNIRGTLKKNKSSDKPVTFMPVKSHRKPRDSTIESILFEIKTHKGIDRIKLQKKTRLGKSTLYNSLYYLEDKEMIKKKFIRKSGNGSVYHYSLSDSAGNNNES
tara:strand:- start:667 stop:990 length:324 start_codon:yes stop_codon:yes gene_type:complete